MAKSGINLRLDYKIGRLEIKNGEISWKPPVSF
jgi:hypothetical protein